MFERGNRYKSFRTLGTRLRSFGRRLMRNYDSPQQSPDDAPNALPPPPSWQVQSEEPLMWQEESHFLPSDSQPQAEVLPDPANRTITPRRRIPASTPPVQRQTQHQSPAQQRPAPSQSRNPSRNQMSDDDILTNIMDFHERREQERERVRLQRIEQINKRATSNVQAKADDGSTTTNNILRRRRMGIDYMDTRSLGGEENTPEQIDDLGGQTEDTSSEVVEAEIAFDERDFDDDGGEIHHFTPMDSASPEPIHRKVDDAGSITNDESFDTDDTSDQSTSEQDNFFNQPHNDVIDDSSSHLQDIDTHQVRSTPDIPQQQASASPIQRSSIESDNVDYQGGEGFDFNNEDFADYAGDSEESFEQSRSADVASDASIQRQVNDFDVNVPENQEAHDIPIQREDALTADSMVQRTPDLGDTEDYEQSPIYDDYDDSYGDDVQQNHESAAVGDVSVQRDFTDAVQDDVNNIPNDGEYNSNAYDDYDDSYDDVVQQNHESTPVGDVSVQRDFGDDVYDVQTQIDHQSPESLQRDFDSMDDDVPNMQTQIDHQSLQRDSGDDGVWDADWMDADEPRFDDFDDYVPQDDGGQMIDHQGDFDNVRQESPSPQNIQRQVAPDATPTVDHQPSMTEGDHQEQFDFDSTQDLPDSHDDSDFVEWVQDVGDDAGTIQRTIMDDKPPVEPVARSPIRRRGAVISEVNTDSMEHLYDTHVPNYDPSPRDNPAQSEAQQTANSDFVQREYDDAQNFDDSVDYQEAASEQWQPSDVVNADGQGQNQPPLVSDSPRPDTIHHDTDITTFQPQSPSPTGINADSRPSNSDVEIVYPSGHVQRDWDDGDAEVYDDTAQETNDIDIYAALVQAGAISPTATQQPSRNVQRAPESSPTAPSHIQAPHDNDPVDAVYETFPKPATQAPDTISRKVVDNAVDEDDIIDQQMNDESRGDQPDIDQIARDVYSKLRDRLRIERERRHKK